MEKQCTKCKEIKTISDFTKSTYIKSGYSARCKKCTNETRTFTRHNGSKDRDKIIEERIITANINYGKRTKGNLIDKRKNIRSARHAITRHAERVMKIKGSPKICEKCGYSYTVQICHIKAIKDFSKDALLSEINHPDNLIYLCPNHHWELDHPKKD